MNKAKGLIYLYISILAITKLSYANERSVAHKKNQSKGIFYYKYIFGHVHQNPSRYSSSLTTISCGHPIRVLYQKNISQSDWELVKVGPHKGYLLKKNLLGKKPRCFQSSYPFFFDSLELGIADYYYWGKLFDHYEHIKVRVK